MRGVVVSFISGDDANVNIADADLLLKIELSHIPHKGESVWIPGGRGLGLTSYQVWDVAHKIKPESYEVVIAVGS